MEWKRNNDEGKNADEAENWCLMPPVDQRPSRNVDCVWSILFASRKGIPLGMRIASGSAVPGPGHRLQVVAVAVKKFLEDRPQGLNWASKILSRF